MPINPLDALRQAWTPTSLQRYGLPRQEVVNLGEAGDMLVPHPPQFQPPPQVVAGPEVDRAMQQLLAFAPGLQGRIGRVQMGPTEDMMTRLDANPQLGGKKYGAEDLPQTGLLGVTNSRTGNISLNQRLTGNPWPVDKDMMVPTLAHEATHAAGWGEDKAKAMGDIVEEDMRPHKMMTSIQALMNILGGNGIKATVQEDK